MTVDQDSTGVKSDEKQTSAKKQTEVVSLRSLVCIFSFVLLL